MPFWKRQRETTLEPAQATGLSDSRVLLEESIDTVQYGMIVVRDKPSEAPSALDVVAIHGLNGHYQKTWTETESPRKVNWLQDLLPEQLPNARIMSYSYNSAVAFGKGTDGIKAFAEQLLEDLMAWRLTLFERGRPIIFICHSLGGIVFKQALVRAHERDRYSNLLSQIQGVAFFGTPHRGSDLADWGFMLANIVKSASFGTRTNTRLISELRSRSEILQDISKSFVDRSKNLVILSFYETDKMDYINCKVVPEQSAVLNLPNETSIAISGNHRTMCRFSNANEQRYRNVWVNLQSMATPKRIKAISEEDKACHLKLYTSDYESHKSRNPTPTTGTCRWVLKNKKYEHWEESLESSLLWISADAGCGKSVLTNFLIDNRLRHRAESPKNVCYFFFKNDNDEQSSSTYALCALLHQIYTYQPELLKHASLQFTRKGPTITKQLDSLWAIFKATVEDGDANDTICFIDGLDECEKSSGNKLVVSLANYFRSGQAHLASGPSLKIIITSRPDNSIKGAFQNLADIRLRGEDETTAISHDVELVVRAGISKMSGSGLPKSLLADLQSKLIEGADRTFLWTALTIKLLEDASERGASKQELDDILLSRDIDDVYARLLTGRAVPVQAKKLLQVVVAAVRPLTLDEMNVAIMIPSGNSIRTHPMTLKETVFANQNPPIIKSLEDLGSHLKLSFENYVKSLCGHFVRIIDRRIYLVHQTAKEYLLRTDSVVKGVNGRNLAFHSFSADEMELEMRADKGYFQGVPDSPLNHSPNEIGKGPFQHSMTIYGAIRELLDTCVSYLYLFDRISISENTPALEFLDYAANYWTIHFKELHDFGVLDMKNPRYMFLADPEFRGFESWASAHTSYRLNFPGRMDIPGSAAAFDRRIELQMFFGLEDLFSSGKMIAAGVITTDSATENESQNAEEVGSFERQITNEDQDKIEGSRIPDRFQRYQDLETLQVLTLEGSRSMSHVPRGNLFPVKSGSLVLDSTPPKYKESKRQKKRQSGHREHIRTGSSLKSGS